MREIWAYCGLSCHTCEAYAATQNGDTKEQKKVAEKWRKQFNMNVTARDILCDGCSVDGNRLSGYCTFCEIRKCARTKEVITCAYCDDYPCGILTKFFEQAPEARENLDNMRSEL
ncbi:MAG: DUF3795 domain-containing protein [Candidatus Methanofastidiosia archaeon]